MTEDKTEELLERLTLAAERQAAALEKVAITLELWDTVYKRRDTGEAIHSVRMTSTTFIRENRS